MTHDYAVPTTVKKPYTIKDYIALLLALLFLYAAFSKLLTYEEFRFQMEKSMLVANHALLLRWLVPAVEIAVALMLFVPALRLWAFCLSLITMIAFSGYIVMIFLLSPSVPCSCGGVLNSMGWKSHLVFNIVFSFIAGAGIVLSDNWKKN